MSTRTLGFVVVTGGLILGCGSPRQPQVVLGRVATDTFPSPVQSVAVIRGSATVTSAQVAADGSFSLSIPPGATYRIEMLATAGQPGLVFPRRVGTIDTSFTVRGATAPFDLGMVRYVGNPTTQRYEFATPSALLPMGSRSSYADFTSGPTNRGSSSINSASPVVPFTGTGAQGDDGDSGGDGQCEDGVDPTTGAVCVDDNGEADQCDGGDQGDHNCENGIDPATGAECDGGPGANQDDGQAGDTGDTGEDGETDDDGQVPSEAAVADHNLPASMGCDGEDGGDDDGGDNGDDDDDDGE